MTNFKYHEMKAAVFTLSLLLFYIVNVVCLDAHSSGNFYYGKYKIFTESLSVSGTKSNFSNVCVECVLEPTTGQAYFRGNITNLNDGPIIAAKSRTWKWNGKRFEYVITFSAINLCDIPNIKKYVLDPLIPTDNQCYLKKGTQTFSMASISNMTYNVIGPKTAFVGRLKVRVLIFSPRENIMTLDMIYQILSI